METRVSEPMSRVRAARYIALGLVAAALTGCYTSERRQDQLAVGCAVRECVCTPERLSMDRERLRNRPVQFHENGNAYCPEGFRLRFREKPRGSFKRYYGG